MSGLGSIADLSMLLGVFLNQLCWILDGCQTAARPTSTVVPQLWESPPLKYPHL